MNILIIAGRFYPDGNANSSILYRLSKFFNDEGHRVTVARIVDWSEPYEELVHQGITILRIPIDRRGLKTRARLLLRRGRIFSGIFHASAHFLTHVFSRLSIADPFLLQYMLSAKALMRVARRSSADVVVTTCDPFWTHNFGYLLKRWCRVGWTMYNLDPYFDNPARDHSESATARRLAEEARMLGAADSAIVTPEIHASYVRSPLRRYLHKVTRLELPVIRDLTSAVDIPAPIDTQYINCSFVGHLYPGLRDPKFVLDVFQRIREPRIRLNIIGGIYGEFPPGYLEALAEPLGSRVVFCPPVDPDTAVTCMRESNVLINIGNRDTDMFPSKFLDYCSTGRPIINFHWSPDCPTLPYSRKYRLCLNIKVNEDETESAAREVEDFIVMNASQRMTYDEVSKNLRCRSSDTISAEFLGVLASSLRTRR